MVWQVAAQAAFSFGQEYMQASEQQVIGRAQDDLNKANVFASNTIGKANADAANLLRGVNNSFLAAQSVLQNTLRSAGNQSRLSAYGDQSNALSENSARIMDSMVRGRLSARLQAAATLGALRADAASRGVGGSSADALRSVVSLQGGAVETQAQDNQKYVTFDALMQKQGLVRAAVQGLDFGQSLPNLDYGINVAPQAQAPILPYKFQPTPFQQGLGAAAGSLLSTWAKGGFGGGQPASPAVPQITAAPNAQYGSTATSGQGLSYPDGGYFNGA